MPNSERALKDLQDQEAREADAKKQRAENRSAASDLAAAAGPASAVARCLIDTNERIDRLVEVLRRNGVRVPDGL